MNPESVVPLAATFRNGTLESLHHGVVVLLDSRGEVQFSRGDHTTIIFPRSALKPLQAHAMIRAGLCLPDELLALVCASHDGRPEHQRGVRDILERAGSDETSLANTPDLPLDQTVAEAVVRGGGTRTSLQQNCSGKHAGMVATCRARHWPADASYLAVDHPLQTTITAGVEELAGEAVHTIGIDGCGAPTHAISLGGLARAFHRLVTASHDEAAGAVHRAMTTHPEMVGGPHHVTTRLMQSIPGLMAKDGAEGVFAMALPDGRAMAMKVADGANRARPPVIRTALEALGVPLEGVAREIFESAVLGHGRRVGEVRSVVSLAEHDTARRSN